MFEKLKSSLNSIEAKAETLASSVTGDDEEKVPGVEKLIQNHDDLPATFEDLKQFAEDELRTGDILIMNCTHSFGKLAQIATMSVWDHVSIVVRLDDIDLEECCKTRCELIRGFPPDPKFSGNDVPENCPKMLYSKPGEETPVENFEAMGGGIFSYPIVEHAIVRGPSIKYCAVRKLRNAEGEPLGKENCAKLAKFVQEFWGRKYESNYAELGRAVLSAKPKGKVKSNKSLEGLDTLFCSELVAEAYQRIGILPEKTLNSNDVLPNMFAECCAVDKLIAKGYSSHGFKLGEEIVFRAPQTPLAKLIKQKRSELWKERIKERKEDIPSYYLNGESHNTNKQDRSLVNRETETETAEMMIKKADWGAYLRRYPDLKKAFGDDESKAENHYFVYGYKEKRDPLPGEPERIAKKADWSAYLKRYPDLRKVFGKDEKKAKQHWFEYGFKENRNPLP